MQLDLKMLLQLNAENKRINCKNKKAKQMCIIKNVQTFKKNNYYIQLI